MSNILDELNLFKVWLTSYLPEWRRWRLSEPDSSTHNEKVRVFYGHDNLRGPDDKVFGGFVKFHDLQQVFPNYIKGANILYLVSSALPHFPGRMVRMAKKTGARIVLNQNGVAYPGWYGGGWERANRNVRCIHNLADHIVYQSHFCKLSADEFIGKICLSGEILYNPVDTEVFVPAENHKLPEQPTLLLAGTHMSFYRPAVAIEAVRIASRKIPDLKMTIAGRFCWERHERNALEQVKKHALQEGVADRVIFVGTYTQKQAISLFQSSSVLLHTKYNDPCPRLVVEAMACGLPVVYSATGGVGELVGRDAGIGIPGPLDWEKDHPPEPEELAEAIVAVFLDYERYRLASRKRAESRFDVKLWLERHEEIFNALV